MEKHSQKVTLYLHAPMLPGGDFVVSTHDFSSGTHAIPVLASCEVDADFFIDTTVAAAELVMLEQKKAALIDGHAKALNEISERMANIRGAKL